MDKIKKILLVCTGNSCRSPIAEGLLRKHLQPEGEYEIMSAGTAGLEGFSPSPAAIEVMKEEGIDISSYLSKGISKELTEKSDIILVMAGVHKDILLEKIPEAKEKVYLLKEFAGIKDDNKEIHDPIGQSVEVYRRIRDEIKNAVEDIVIKLKSEGEGR